MKWSRTTEIKNEFYKTHKDRNWDNVMFSDEWTFYLKAPGGMRCVIKINNMWWQESSIFIRLIVGEHFQKKKSGFVIL